MASQTRVALITGCAKPIGIGSATARLLAASGVSVMVADIAAKGVTSDNEAEDDLDRSWKGLDSLVEEIAGKGGVAASVHGDVSDEADAARMVQATVERFGRLDILVNNAGAPHGRDRGQIEDVPADAWDRVMAVNARGVFLMCRAAVPIMRKQGWGRIINISSTAALNAVPQRAAYSASKAAVLGLTKSLAFDLAPAGITVNALCPGSVRTTRAISTTRLAGWKDVDAGMAERAKGIPMGRHGEADEMAGVIAFLASEASSYVTGQSILADGGGLPIMTAKR